VREASDLGGLDAPAPGELADRLQDGGARIAAGRRHLDDMQRAAGFAAHDIGERAADIDSDLDAARR